MDETMNTMGAQEAADKLAAIDVPVAISATSAREAEVPADVVRRAEHDLTRLIDQGKGWSEQEANMFVELVERRLQDIERRVGIIK
jgi:hypothetical protein